MEVKKYRVIWDDGTAAGSRGGDVSTVTLDEFDTKKELVEDILQILDPYEDGEIMFSNLTPEEQAEAGVEVTLDDENWYEGYEVKDFDKLFDWLVKYNENIDVGDGSPYLYAIVADGNNVWSEYLDDWNTGLDPVTCSQEDIDEYFLGGKPYGVATGYDPDADEAKTYDRDEAEEFIIEQGIPVTKEQGEEWFDQDGFDVWGDPPSEESARELVLEVGDKVEALIDAAFNGKDLITEEELENLVEAACALVNIN